MMNRDLLLYVVHGGFWASFGAAGLLVKQGEQALPGGQSDPPVAAGTATASFSRTLLAIHFLAFGVLYFGLGNSIVPDRVPEWIGGQRIIGAAIIMAGAAVMGWARVSFQSWRFRAKLDEGHQLATGGPFRYIRHPIYMGLNLLALGSAVWDPALLTWTAVGLMVLGSDLRGRAEERLLSAAYGETYLAYMQRTKRFLPGVY